MLFLIVCYYFIPLFLFIPNRFGLAEEPSFAVALTTIPPRFVSIVKTLNSLLGQDYPPVGVFIFIPNSYIRFSRIKGSNSPITLSSTREQLIAILSKHRSINSSLEHGLIKVISTDTDWGPATKFAGILSYYHHYMRGDTFPMMQQPNYWIICDDDVKYRPIMISKYFFALSTQPLNYENQIDGLTNFSEDYRVSILVNNKIRHLMHIQGVDTFLISSKVFSKQCETSGPLSYIRFNAMIKYFHRVCPSSFYQDDYIISLALNIANIVLKSIWNNDNMAEHIEGSSKSNFQMHMHPKVFLREEETKKCIVENAQAAYSLAVYGTEDIAIRNEL